MTEFSTERTRADKIAAPQVPPTKIPREGLITLHVEANPCARVFQRVLRLVTGSALIPVDVLFEQGGKIITIDLRIDRADFVPTAWFLGQIEGVPAVRSADFLDHRGQSLFPAKVGDDGDLIAVGSLGRVGWQDGRGIDGAT